MLNRPPSRRSAVSQTHPSSPWHPHRRKARKRQAAMSVHSLGESAKSGNRRSHGSSDGSRHGRDRPCHETLIHVGGSSAALPWPRSGPRVPDGRDSYAVRHRGSNCLPALDWVTNPHIRSRAPSKSLMLCIRIQGVYDYYHAGLKGASMLRESAVLPVLAAPLLRSASLQLSNAVAHSC